MFDWDDLRIFLAASRAGSLSAAGQKRADEARRLGEIFNDCTLGPLSKPERAAFLQMLTRLVEAYRRELSRSEIA